MYMAMAWKNILYDNFFVKLFLLFGVDMNYEKMLYFANLNCFCYIGWVSDYCIDCNVIKLCF